MASNTHMKMINIKRSNNKKGMRDRKIKAVGGRNKKIRKSPHFFVLKKAFIKVQHIISINFSHFPLFNQKYAKLNVIFLNTFRIAFDLEKFRRTGKIYIKFV